MAGPRVIASVVLKRDDKILLIKEILESNKEYWIFPGGGVEFGETLEEAAVREMKEETGLDVKITKFLGFKEAIFPNYDYHTIIFFFLAEPLSEDIILMDGILDVGYFTIDEMEELNLVKSARWLLEEIKEKNIL